MLRFLGALSFFILFTLAFSQEEGYCFQFLSSKKLEVARSAFERLKDYNLPLLRVEKIGDYYVVRAGFFRSREEARKLRRTLRELGLSALFVRCIYDEKRIITSLKKTERKSIPVTKKPWSVRLTLEELGFTDDVLLEGARVRYTFYFPVLPELKEGRAVFLLRVPKQLPKDSRLVLLVDGVAKESIPLHKTGGSLSVELPFKPKEGRHFVELALDFHLYEPEDICDALNSSLWAVILRESAIYVELKDELPDTIRDFLLDYKPRFEVEGEKKELARFSYYLASLYRRYNLYNLRFGEGKKVRIVRGEARLVGDELELPAEFLLKKEDFYLLTQSARASFLEITKERGAVSFANLGFRTQTHRGWGKAVYSIPFFFGPQRKGEVLLRFSWGAPEGGGAWISVLLNNALIWYEELSGFGRSERLLELPADELRKGLNTLTVVFAYVPEEGFCRGTIPDAYFTLWDDSVLITKGKGEYPKRVRDYLSSLEGSVALYIGEGVPEELVTEFFKNLGYLNPRVEVWRSSDSPTESPQTDWLVILDRFEELHYGSFPLLYDEGVRVYDPYTGRTLWSVKANYDFIVLQVGDVGGRRALFVGVAGHPKKETLKFLRFDFLSGMEGNAVIVHEEGVFNFTLPERQRVEIQKKNPLLELISRYRYVLLFLTIGLITFLILLLWRRNR
ncbi:MAG: hypothetical protein GXO04_04040 [Aquificae bacterium]|nr:hypothetical protein [Aquificota bacterium]